MSHYTNENRLCPESKIAFIAQSVRNSLYFRGFGSSRTALRPDHRGYGYISSLGLLEEGVMRGFSDGMHDVVYRSFVLLAAIGILIILRNLIIFISYFNIGFIDAFVCFNVFFSGDILSVLLSPIAAYLLIIGLSFRRAFPGAEKRFQSLLYEQLDRYRRFKQKITRKP
jgi:hypothetical protein